MTDRADRRSPMAARAPVVAAVMTGVTVMLSLGGCADAPAPAPAPIVAARPAAPASGIVLTPQPATPDGTGAVVLVNDPSAPSDTPLCGTAAREANAMGQALLGRQYANAGICTGFACYDPATATYIGADGYHHVCR